MDGQQVVILSGNYSRSIEFLVVVRAMDFSNEGSTDRFSIEPRTPRDRDLWIQ
jgi:hypothetical protein